MKIYELLSLSGCISLEESKLRSLISGRLEVLCKRNDTHKSRASVAIFLFVNIVFVSQNVPAKTVWASYTVLFCKKVGCHLYPLTIQF